LRYLITGGAGFIGSALAHELFDRGEDVRVLDNLATGNIHNLDKVKRTTEIVQGDICDLPTVERAMQGVDFVLHQAALPSVPRSVTDPLSSHRANADGTLNVLWAAKQAGVRRVVHTSTIDVFEAEPGGRIDESFRFAMDWDLLVRFRDAGARFARLPRFIGGFRIHPQQKTAAAIAKIGFEEMDRIRKRALGRVPSRNELRRALIPYLIRHLATDLGWRVKTRLGVYT